MSWVFGVIGLCWKSAGELPVLSFSPGSDSMSDGPEWMSEQTCLLVVSVDVNQNVKNQEKIKSHV